MQARKNTKTKNGKVPVGGNGATLGIEAELWASADKMRGHLDAAEYKNVVLGLIFLKYISDAFEQLHSRLVAKQKEGADPEDRDEYAAERFGMGNDGSSQNWLKHGRGRKFPVRR